MSKKKKKQKYLNKRLVAAMRLPENIVKVCPAMELEKMRFEFTFPMVPDETWVSDEKGPYRIFQRMMERE